MPPKKKFSKDQVLEAAFNIARREGLSHLSARTVAQKLGCSTSPIYSLFESMELVEQGVCKMSTEMMLGYQTTARTGFPFLDMGLGYIVFAREEKMLFRDMFMNVDKLKPYSQGMIKFAHEELMEKVMDEDRGLADLGRDRKIELLRTMWIFAHGIAAQMSINALPDMTDEELLLLLRSVTDPVVDRVKNE